MHEGFSKDFFEKFGKVFWITFDRIQEELRAY